MKKIKKNLKFITVLIIIVIIIAGLYFYKNYNIKNNQNLTNITSEINKTLNTDVKNNKNTNDKIIYTKINDNDKQVLESDADGKNIKILFSDKGQNLKINKFGGLAYLSNEVLIYVGNDPIGKLEVVKTDGTGNNTIINDSFGTPQAVSISPDGKVITYVSFSNVETDYGYSIYTMTRSGTNKRKIITSDQNIQNLAINYNASKVAYSTIDQNNKSQINIAELSSGKSSQIYTSSNPIYSLAWSSSDKIIFSIATNKLQAGEIYDCNSDGSQVSKLFSSKENLPVYANISSDNLNYSYILNSYKDNFDPTKQGDLYTNKQKIDKANTILGWLP